MPTGAQVPERTVYPPLLQIIREKGGSEVLYDAVPDIEFDFLGQRWLSVEIGDASVASLPVFSSTFGANSRVELRMVYS